MTPDQQARLDQIFLTLVAGRFDYQHLSEYQSAKGAVETLIEEIEEFYCG